MTINNKKTKTTSIILMTFIAGILMIPISINTVNAETILIDDNFSIGLNDWIYSYYCNACSVSPVQSNNDIPTINDKLAFSSNNVMINATSSLNPLPSVSVALGDDNYALSIDENDGQLLPSALISGDGFATTSGMEKSITLPDKVTSAILSFDGKAQGTYPSHQSIPNLIVQVFDNNDVSLHSEYVIGPPDNPSSLPTTNWQSFEIDITEYVTNQNSVTVFLGLSDAWIANWDQKVWIDNVMLTVENDSETIYCGLPESDYANIIEGTESSDYLKGTKNADLILGYGGNDFIRGAGGNDCIYAGDGDDFIQGGNGDDTVYAGNGDDVIRTGAGNDTVYGEDGDDILHAVNKNGSNTLDGGNGDDICIPANKKVTTTTNNCEITE